MSAPILRPVGELRPIWSPEDTRQLAADAAKHQPERGEKHRLRDWVFAPILIFCGILFPGLAAPEAHADPVTDSAYVAVLRDRGITYPTRSEAITDGYRVCSLLGAGMAPLAVAAQFSSNSGLSLSDSAYVVGAAIAAFCDEYSTSVAAAA